MQLYDTHSHILPEFDDGSDSVEESLRMLGSLSEQGINNVCLTPHFYTNKMSLETFIAMRNEAFEKFKPHIPDNIKIVLGAEVYVTKYILTNTDISQITYGKSKYILAEFPYASTFEGKSFDQLMELINNFGLIPVLPHVERYKALLEDPSIIAELKDLGVVIQSNIANYTKQASFFHRRKMLRLVNDGYIDILGTDAHSMSRRSPELFTEAMNTISDKCGSERLARMIYNAKAIFDSAYGE